VPAQSLPSLLRQRVPAGMRVTGLGHLLLAGWDLASSHPPTEETLSSYQCCYIV